MPYESPPSGADKNLPRRPVPTASPFASDASPVPGSRSLNTTLDLRTPPSTPPVRGSTLANTTPPNTPATAATEAPAESVAAAVARPERPDGWSSASAERLVAARCDIVLDETMLLLPPKPLNRARGGLASGETEAGDEALSLPSTHRATAIGIARTPTSVAVLSGPVSTCVSTAGETSSEAGRFPWLTSAQEAQERGWSVEPWERVFNKVDVGVQVPGCHIPLYNTDKLVARATMTVLTAHCYVQYFLQWRLFKDSESKKAFKMSKGPLCQQRNSFCMDPDAIIKSIPTLWKAYRKTDTWRKQQLHRQSFDAHIACACLGFCPCCTASNSRFDHKFRSHPDYSLLDDQLRRMIAREANPTHTTPADLNESLDFLIHSMKEHANTVANVLSGLKRKVSE